jgi:uncharacterized membrane protein
MAIYLGVLFALGGVMMFWSLAACLSTSVVAGISITALLLTQWITPGPEAFAFDYPVWVRMLQIPGRSGPFVVFYPVIPWLAIAGLGIVIGRGRRPILANLPRGAVFTAGVLLTAFIIVRGTGGYGNFHAPAVGWIGFLNVTKYPPSLAFILLTLGLNTFLLGIFSAGRGRVYDWLAVFGRTPLFFYILHLYLYGLLGWVVPSGVSPGLMLVFWLAGLAMLYPLCRFYDRFKQTKPPDTLWRLL